KPEPTTRRSILTSLEGGPEKPAVNRGSTLEGSGLALCSDHDAGNTVPRGSVREVPTVGEEFDARKVLRPHLFILGMISLKDRDIGGRTGRMGREAKVGKFLARKYGVM